MIIIDVPVSYKRKLYALFPKPLPVEHFQIARAHTQCIHMSIYIIILYNLYFLNVYMRLFVCTFKAYLRSYECACVEYDYRIIIVRACQCIYKIVFTLRK